MDMTGKGKEAVEAGSDDVVDMLEWTAKEDLDAVQVYGDVIEKGISELPQEILVDLPTIIANGGDLHAVADRVAEYDATLGAMIHDFASNVDQYGFEAALNMED